MITEMKNKNAEPPELELLTTATGRNLAVRALRDKHGNVSAMLRRLISEMSPSVVERSFARELAMGVIRRRSTLQAVIEKYLKNPNKKLPSPIKEIMYVALYQVLFLDRVPAFAAVDAAVEQTKNSHHKRQSGLVNGLLRTVVREMSTPIEAAMETKLTGHHILLGGGKLRRFKREILPDPESKPAENMAAAYSLPQDLINRWIDEHGLDDAAKLARHACGRPPLIVRVNLAKTDIASAMDSLTSEGATVGTHENGCSIVLEISKNFTQMQAFKEGLFQPQDPTATAVVNAMDIQPGMRVLDLCAAPGTKTTHMAERMKNEGHITAVDVSSSKIMKISDSCKRMDISIVETMRAPDVASLQPHSFDIVLVDAPCSNTGVLARRPEARWRFAYGKLDELKSNQNFLADQGANLVKPGGQLIYSTCSIEPEENSDIAHSLVETNPSLELIELLQTLPAGEDCPEKWHDGGFYAKFRMKS